MGPDEGWGHPAVVEPQIRTEHVGPRSSLFREANPMQQLLKTRITSQWVESGIHPDERHSIRPVAVGLLEPSIGLFFIAQSCI